MARPRKEIEPTEDRYLKVQRVLGQKVTRIMDCEYWQQFPEIYEKLMKYEIVELPESLIKKIYGIKLIENTEIEIEKEEE
jgi:hypothetical protein